MKKYAPRLWLMFVLLFLYAPIGILAVYSFTKSTMIGRIRGFSIQNYIHLFTTPELMDMIFGTISLAVLVSLLSVGLGTIGAVGMHYGAGRSKGAVDFLNRIPVVNADVVTGFSVCILLIVFFRIPKDSYVPLVLGLLVLCTPFAYLSVLPRLTSMDPHLYEAALDLGATPVRAFFAVVFPEILPGMVGGFFTSITLSIDDYFITTYTKPAAFDTISTYVVNATKGAQTATKTALWALSTVIFALVVLLVVGSYVHSTKTLALCAVLFALLFFSGCGKSGDDVLTLRIANCEEYIDEGDWDEKDAIELPNGEVIIGKNPMVEDFEDWYYATYGERVKVEYSTYGTNEDLYNQLTLGSRFDLVCPSEYMILKLMEEGRLQPLSSGFFDETNDKNAYVKGVSPYISKVFQNLSQDGEAIDRYAAGYMWGTMGVVYAPDAVEGKDLRHWSLLLEDAYKKQITMKDGVRDSYFIALCILNEEKLLSEEFLTLPDYEERLAELLNETDEDVVAQAEEILSAMRQNAYSLETDSGKADMVSGKVVANMQWSGDAVYSIDQAEEDGVELAFFVPEEGSNLWFDGWCMLRDGIGGDEKRQQAAEAFINFVSQPDNVVRNMAYIGYTSCISGGGDDTIFDYARYCYESEDSPDGEDVVAYSLDYFFGDSGASRYVIYADEDQMRRQLFAQYPPEDVLHRCAVMRNFPPEAGKRISQMWTNIRCYRFPWETVR